jgi:septum formation protein
MSARPHLILASASPQRRAILERLGIDFEQRPASVEEVEEGDPQVVAVENALRKARAAWGMSPAAPAAGGQRHHANERSAHELVLGVDTMVQLDGRIYGKPADEQAARETLAALSGRTHDVVSGIALIDGGGERTAAARTRVRFRALDERTIAWYVACGEWRDRAGGYAIQGAGAALVRAIEGDYENVVGLPLATLLDLEPRLLGRSGA